MPSELVTSDTLGILSLDTAFPRVLGDAGNPQSYPFSAKVHVVRGADPTKVVIDGTLDDTLMQGFIAGAQHLEASGARAIVSTCGFLITSQADIASKVDIPVMLSALSLLPLVQATIPNRIGILTASRSSLGELAFRAAGADLDRIVVRGLENARVFADTFLAKRSDQPDAFDRALMEQTIVGEAIELVENAPDVGAILLECGNLPPYADAIRKATGKPVFHMLDAARMLMAANTSRG